MEQTDRYDHAGMETHVFEAEHLTWQNGLTDVMGDKQDR